METEITEGRRPELAEDSPKAMYDRFSDDYDRFVDWEGRLDAEMPFIVRQLQTAGATRVLDVACGTGMHAIALTQVGYDVVGTDASDGMVEQARANASDAGGEVRFEVARFGRVSEMLRSSVQQEPFDAILCLGNSLPHVLRRAALHEALRDFERCLRPSGLLLVQNRNFNAVLAEHNRWMRPQSHQKGESEWLFLRFYDFEPENLLRFNIVTLYREGSGPWSQQVTTTKLWPLTKQELYKALHETGFEHVAYYGDMEGAPFHAESSPNLVAVARAAS